MAVPFQVLEDLTRPPAKFSLLTFSIPFSVSNPTGRIPTLFLCADGYMQAFFFAFLQQCNSVGLLAYEA
jgi:hypothetical protein